ncbi:hypothetical protein EV652_10322 [Kribbella steppae]|uniref:Uncharacterized protein n=1 Tax=Kribbella steppae TaxID=2512223 RepID=A0A4R2HPA3_9ACTN|nr:hypothetical protein [Kribbella steppae]TCO33023.1 hypothetical protein EV652_10322 [Kribbella steppae]
MPNEPWLDELVSNVFNDLARRLPGGDVERPRDLAVFHERLDELRTLAETTSDQLRSDNYAWLWRTMGDELGFVVDDLGRGRITPEDLSAAYEQWSELGRSYVRTITDNGDADAIFTTAPSTAELAHDSSSDHLGVDPIKAHLEQRRAEALAAGDPSRADELEHTLVMIGATTKDFAWLAAQNEQPETDLETQRSSERARLHYAIHEYAFQYDIDVPHGMLDELPAGRTPHWLRDDDDLEADTHPLNADASDTDEVNTQEAGVGGEDRRSSTGAADETWPSAAEVDDSGGDLTDEDMRGLTAELAVDPYDDVVWGGVVMSRADLDLELEECTEFGDLADAADVAVDDSTIQSETTGAPGQAPNGDAVTAEPELHDSAGTDEVSAAVETSACSVAVSRASATVETAALVVEEAAGNDRADQLATWHDDDQAAQRQVEDQASKASTTIGDGTAR